MNDKEQQIIQLYQEENLSTHHIADKFSTYPNKIRRILKKHGVQLRGKGEAQKIALEQGRTEHPTKGKVFLRPRSKVTVSQGFIRVFVKLISKSGSESSKLVKNKESYGII